jgi:hypothetical protein
MRPDRQRALDRAITQANVYQLRGALREALGIREHELVNRKPGELVDLLTEAVEYVTDERRLARSPRSLAAQKRFAEARSAKGQR